MTNYKTKQTFTINIILSGLALALSILSACSTKKEKQSEEQIVINPIAVEDTPDSLLNSITGNATMKQIASFPSRVILTGMDDHRLVTVYKSKQEPINSSSGARYSYDTHENMDEYNQHFMPGIDILFGYNLLNIAHYDLKLEKGNFLFNHPVLVKTVYYPSFVQDSLNKQPINRNYYLVSVYDEDTNKESLINKKDLRRFYHFDATSSQRNQLIPSDYSVIRSQYDAKNDCMYVFARHDENKNGTQEVKEPVHIFLFSLKSPDKAKLLY